jgi:hypothetical protein
MALLKVSSILGKTKVGGLMSKAQFLRNKVGQLESFLGVKSDILLIGALEEKNFVDTIVDDFRTIGDLTARKISQDYKQDGVQVDAIVDYQGEMSVTLTKNPVQKNADITDHRIPQPKTLVVELGVSNDVVSSLAGNIKKVVGGFASMIGTSVNDRRILTYNNFEDLMLRGKPFTVLTPHGIYENMLITKIKPHTNIETEGLFYGTIEFQEVIFFEDVKNQDTSPQASNFWGDLKDNFLNSLQSNWTSLGKRTTLW